jgi:uncharacterized membrane protein YphA (DoxX/SURF4 family)
MKRGQKFKGRGAITFGLAVFLGLVFVLAGTGKLPGQAEFIDALVKSFWTPGLAYFIGHVFPWVEVALGILLILGLFPRIVAAVCLPLIIAFMANNFWALNQGLGEFPHCAMCFGIWEKYIGAISPGQALGIDAVLFGAALIVVILHPDGFLKFRPWFIRRAGD